MTLSLDLDALERCQCRDGCAPECVATRRLMNGTFYEHTKSSGPPVITPEKWERWTALQRRREIGAVA